MGKRERLERLMECWRVLLSEWEQARRWRDRSPVGGLMTALKIVDACIQIEEGCLAQRDKFGNVISDPDQLVLARLREIATSRNIFEGVLEEGVDAPATSDEVADGPAEPEVPA